MPERVGKGKIVTALRQKHGLGLLVQVSALPAAPIIIAAKQQEAGQISGDETAGGDHLPRP